MRVLQALSRSAIVIGLALRARDVCNALIRERLHDGIDPTRNGEQRLARAVAPQSSSFIDVGANVGEWTAMFVESAPAGTRGLLVEPSQQAVSILRERFAPHPEIAIVHAAASDQRGEATFHEGQDASESSSLLAGPVEDASVERAVTLTTLDDEAARLGLESIDFVKIDAEGHDLHVLRGAAGLLSEQRIGAVQFEYHKLWAATGSTLGEATSLLRSAGYELFRVRASGLDRFEYEPYRDYFGYSNYAAVAPSRIAEVEPLIRPPVSGAR